MTSYYIKLDGRMRNALGVTSEYERIIEAESAEEALIKLYEEFDHVRARRTYQLHWTKHMGHRFGFSEPAHFVEDRENGGYFANATGKQIYSLVNEKCKEIK